MRFPTFLNRQSHAFSLVEVVMALGIFAFAIMGIIGLIPVAIETHREAKLDTILSQLQQRLAAELMLTDGSELTGLSGIQRNFDAEGREISSGSIVYSAKVLFASATLPGGVTSSSLQRAVLFTVPNPAAKPDIATTSPTAGFLVAKAENAP